jgi:hypothetical protein
MSLPSTETDGRLPRRRNNACLRKLEDELPIPNWEAAEIWRTWDWNRLPPTLLLKGQRWLRGRFWKHKRPRRGIRHWSRPRKEGSSN